MFERRLQQRILSGETTARLRPDASVVLQDVLDHLRSVFNVRQGSVPTRPDLGMPDLNDFVRSFPDAIGLLQDEIRRQIAAFEPRLTEVAVRHVEVPEKPLSIVFAVSATLSVGDDGRHIAMETEVTDDGFVKLTG